MSNNPSKMVTVTVKRSKNSRWNVSVGDERVGQVDSLNEATTLLYSSGYKVYSYRRTTSRSGKMGFTAACIAFTREEV